MGVPLAVLAFAAMGACASSRRAAPAGPPADPVPAALVEGDRARRDGDLDAALRAYERAVAASPSDPRGHLRRVATLLESGRRAEAKSIYFARAAASDATEPERVMANRLAGDGSTESLRTAYRAAAAASSASPWWRVALAELEVADADRETNAALRAIDRGDPTLAEESRRRAKEAITRARAAVEAAPSEPEVDVLRGLLASIEGDVESTAASKNRGETAAIAAYRRALDRAPDLVDAWTNLAVALERTSDVPGALDAWTAAAKLAPRDPDVRAGLARALSAAKRHEEAALQWTEAARARPRDADPLLGAGREWLEAGDPSRAEEAYRRALRRDAAAIEAHLGLGIALERQGRSYEAVASYDTYVRAGGSHATEARRRAARLFPGDRRE